mgnify:CR=1 FL=1
MANPKLALIPAAQGDKFYSALPSNGDGDFDFTRASAATRINKNGLIEAVQSGISRLEYPLINGVVTGCPSHLLEPQRTNLLIYSNNFNTYWSLLGVGTGSAPIVTGNNSISPEGSLNASKVVLNTGAGTSTSDKSSIEVSIAVSQGSDYNISVYLKGSNNGDKLMIGSVSGGYELITLTNKWDRYSINQTAASSPRSVFIGIRQGVFGALNSNIEFEMYGFQLEQGSYVTSYVPTNGTTVTRSGETANNAGNADLFNDSEGVLVAELSSIKDSTDSNVLSVKSGSSDKFQLFYFNGNEVRVNFIDNSGIVFSLISSINPYNSNKLLFKYKANDFALWVNGFEAATNTTSNVVLSGLNNLSFDNGSGLSNFYGKTKELQYFNLASTDIELEKLTSWTSFVDMAQGQQYITI